MTLHIDSRQNTRLILTLDNTEKIIEYDSPRQQDILVAIEKFLQEQQKTLSDLTGIQVETGPGTFTSLRLGITIANTLAYALNIPINGQPPGTTIGAEYGKPASITTPRVEVTPNYPIT